MISEKILIVDDQKNDRFLIEEILKRRGFVNVFWATNGPEALKMVEKNLPNLILLDLMMPQMNGYQVCKQLQANDKTKHIPIIVISAKTSSRYLKQSFELGALDYITKPIDPIELVTRIGSVLKLKKQYDEILKAYDNVISINEKLEKLCTTDALTGVKNARYFWEQLSIELDKFRRFKHPLSLVLADIDDFKKINDSYGHLVGDKVLKQTGELFRQRLRRYDLVARYGGEEFAFVLVNTDLNCAGIVGEKIRQVISESEIALKNEKLKYTISLGAASLTPNSPNDIIDTHYLVDSADQALYTAKRSGKNRVVLFDEIRSDFFIQTQANPDSLENCIAKRS